MIDILSKDKNFMHLTHSYVHGQVRGLELPYPPNIKIEENPKLFAIYAILDYKIKTIPRFCILSYAERIICSRKCIFDEILSKFWLF